MLLELLLPCLQTLNPASEILNASLQKADLTVQVSQLLARYRMSVRGSTHLSIGNGFRHRGLDLIFDLFDLSLHLHYLLLQTVLAPRDALGSFDLHDG